MTNNRNVSFAGIALMSMLLLAPVVASAQMAGIMMQDGKMMMMRDGKATGPMEHEMTMPDGHKVMPDGTMRMNDGKEMRMQEGQMMTMDGKMEGGGHGMKSGTGSMGGKPMESGQGMKMEGMGK